MTTRAPGARADCPSASVREQVLAGAVVAPEVRTHIDACPACRAALDEMRANNALLDRLRTETAVSDGGVPTPGGDPGAVPGFTLLGELHRGAQGIVYRAQQDETNRTVAVKVLLAGAFATSAQRRRFEREIELVAGLDHPGIVTVFGSGRTTGGAHFFAMQWIDGVPLDAWIRERRDLRTVTGLFEAIAGAVSFAHQRGVLHRDLKPANIVVDNDGAPHVLDFGLARPVDEDVRARVTMEGAFVGTLAYAAPEQTRGDPGLVDVRSDVYALGVILFEMLTGALPFPVAGDLAESLRAICEDDPPALRAREGIRPDDDLETIVRTAMAKDPARRYQSAAALRDDVARWRDGAPIEAKRDRTWYVLRKSLARHRLEVAVAGLFVLLLVAATVATVVQNRRIRDEVEKLTQINLFLEDTLGSVQPARAGDDVTVREMLDEAEQWIAIALGDTPEVAAALHVIVGNGYRNLGRFDDAERHLARALEMRLDLYGDEHEQVAQALNAMGLLRRSQGRTDEARELLERALAMRERRLGPDSLEVSLSHANLARLYEQTGDRAAARAALERSLEIRRALYGPRHPDVAMCLFGLARIAEQDGNEPRALLLHKEALRVRGATLHPDHPDLARSLEALGRLILRSPEHAHLAAPKFRDCLALRARLLPPNHWQIAVTRSDYAEALLRAGDGDGAQRQLDLAAPFITGSPDAQDAVRYDMRRDLVASWRRDEVTEGSSP